MSPHDKKAKKVEDVPIFQLYTTFLDSLNIIFTVFFTLEFVLKFGAFRFKVGAVISYCKSFSLVHLKIEKQKSNTINLFTHSYRNYLELAIDQ